MTNFKLKVISPQTAQCKLTPPSLSPASRDRVPVPPSVSVSFAPCSLTTTTNDIPGRPTAYATASLSLTRRAATSPIIRDIFSMACWL